MDEQLHDIDDLFQSAVKRHSELPTDNVWQHLEKNLQKRKVTSITKKYKKWRWVAAALFILSVGLAIYTIQLTWRYKKEVNETKPGIINSTNRNNPSDKIESSRRSANQVTSPNTVTGETGKQKTLIGNNGEDKVRERNEGAANKNSIMPTLTNEGKNGDTHPYPSKGEDVRLPGKNNKNEKQQIITQSSISHGSSALAAKNYKNNNLTNKPLPYNLQKNNDAKVVTGNSDFEILENNMGKTDNKTGVPLSTISSAQKDLIPVSSGKDEIDLKLSLIRAALQLLTMEPSVMPYSNITYSVLRKSSTANKNIRLTPKSLHPEKYMASIFYSGQIVSTDLKANRPDFREDNYLQIKNHEKNRVSKIIGLTLTRKVISNLSIVSGISLSTYITDITRKPLVARKDNSGRINYRISTSSGYAYYSVKARPQPALADSIQTLSSTSTVKYIAVPLGLQYNFYLGRFGFTPSFLVYANFKSTANITTIQSLEHTYTSNIEGLKSHYFDGNIGLGIDYYVKKKIVISLIPAARFGLSAATEKNPVVSQRHSVGLMAGLGFIF